MIKSGRKHNKDYDLPLKNPLANQVNKYDCITQIILQEGMQCFTPKIGFHGIERYAIEVFSQSFGAADCFPEFLCDRQSCVLSLLAMCQKCFDTNSRSNSISQQTKVSPERSEDRKHWSFWLQSGFNSVRPLFLHFPDLKINFADG